LATTVRLQGDHQRGPEFASAICHRPRAVGEQRFNRADIVTLERTEELSQRSRHDPDHG